MKGIKSFYTGAFLVATIVVCSVFVGQKVFDVRLNKNHTDAVVEDSDFGLFLAAQHALSINDFDTASTMINAVKSNDSVVAQSKNIADFFSGKMPQNAAALKDSKDIIDGLIYDAFLIQQDNWKDIYKRHNKDESLLVAPLRVFSAAKNGKTKEALKFIDSLKTNDSWKAFMRGQIAVLNKDIDGAAKEFAKVHPEFMNINDYLYLMSFYKENGMIEDMDILRNDFLAKPGGMYVLNYPDIPQWSNYTGYKNNLVFSIIQNISHTQIMIYTDLSLMFLRFAQIISNESNMDAINYYLGQYYFTNVGDYETCFNNIDKSSPLYLFGKLKIAEKNKDFKTIENIAHNNPLFVPAVQTVVRQYLKNGDKGGALGVLNRALKQKDLPDNGKMYFLKQRAYVYLMFDDATRAQKDLDAVQDIDPMKTYDYMLLQARIWFLQNRNLDEAYNYTMSLIKKNSSDVAAWDLLGQIVDKKESTDNALEIMERIGGVSVSVSAVYEHLGDLYYKKGDKEKALRSYQQALDLSDDGLVVVPFVQRKIRKIK